MSVARERPKMALPKGWEHVEKDGYHMLIKRDGCQRTNLSGEPYRKDVVVVVTDQLAGVVKGEGARQSWQVDDPSAAGRRLANVLETHLTHAEADDLDAVLEEAAKRTTRNRRIESNRGGVA